MKITKKQLMQIIKEELENVMEARGEAVYQGDQIGDWAVSHGGQQVSQGFSSKSLIDALGSHSPAALETYEVNVEGTSRHLGSQVMNGAEALDLAKRDWATHPQNPAWGKGRPKRPTATFFDASDANPYREE